MPLAKTKATRSRPLLAATAVGTAFAGTLVALDYTTVDTLPIRQVSEVPKLDGRMDEEVWRTVRPVTVRTMQGSGLGGSGELMVEIRAVRDDRKVYFAFRWQDPSRSLRRVPMIKRSAWAREPTGFLGRRHSRVIRGRRLSIATRRGKLAVGGERGPHYT